jgi:pilus assembly protein CpaB
MELYMKKVYLIATVLALITGLAVYFFADTLQKNTYIQDAPTTPVVTAVVDINENTLITKEMLIVKQLPSVAVIGTAAKSIEEVAGKVCKYPLVAGEQVVLPKLSEVGSEKAMGLSLQLQKGQRAMTISVDDIIGVAGYINKGDYVDIISVGLKDSAQTTNLLLEKVRIIKIGNRSEENKGQPAAQYSTITLTLSPSDCLKLSQAMATGAIRLSLRPLMEQK